MVDINLVYRTFRGVLISALLVVTLVLSVGQVEALAEPLTPEAAAYEIDKAPTPEAAGQRLQAKAKAYKEELKEGPKPIQETAKTVTKNTQNVFDLAAKRVQETLKLDEPDAGVSDRSGKS